MNKRINLAIAISLLILSCKTADETAPTNTTTNESSELPASINLAQLENSVGE
jgi:hypothetical protein